MRRRSGASEVGDLDFELAEAVHEIGTDALDIARDMHPHAPLVQFLEQDAQLQFGEPRPDAAVDAIAEGDMAASVLAREIELG